MTRAKILGLEIIAVCFGNNEKLGWATLARDSSLLILARSRSPSAHFSARDAGLRFLLISRVPPTTICGENEILMVELPPITLRLRAGRLVGRVAFALLLLGSIAFGALAGLLFVTGATLPQIRALEDFRPDIVTELYADDGQIVGSFALQRRILLTYEQIPAGPEGRHPYRPRISTLNSTGAMDFTAVAGAAWRNLLAHRVAEGASTLTMQLAARCFSTRSDRTMRRKIQETLLALQIERHYYTKQQIFTMYCNQI